MKTHSEILALAIRHAGSAGDLAFELGLKKSAIWAWKWRKRIPPIHWPDLIAMGIATPEELRAGWKV